MPIYMLEPPQSEAGARIHADGVIVVAGSVNAARDVGRSLYPADSNAAWDNAVATELVEVGTINDANGMQNFEAQIRVLAPAGGAVVADLTVAAAPTDTVDQLMAKVVTALIAAGLANAAYASPTLTVATIPDAIGDHKLILSIRPTGPNLPDGVAIRDYTTNVVDEGIAAAVLTVDVVPAALRVQAIRDYRFSEGAIVPTPY